MLLKGIRKVRVTIYKDSVLEPVESFSSSWAHSVVSGRTKGLTRTPVAGSVRKDRGSYLIMTARVMDGLTLIEPEN